MKTRLPEHGPLETPRFWRTLEERTETPEAQAAAHDEFLPGAGPTGYDDVHGLPVQSGFSRRDFLGLVTASAALAATVACDRKGQGTVVPYTKRPVEVVPGVANYYASAHQEGRRVYPVLVKTREGRPIHLTGNDEHPGVKGKTSPRTMADVLRLYDPDRLRAPKAEGRVIGWAEAETRLNEALKAAKASGKPVLLVSGAVASPTRKALLADLKAALPVLEHLAYEPAAGDAAEEAAKASFGQPVDLQPRLTKAKVILSLGADFLNGEDPESLAAWGAQRRLKSAQDPINRLWVLEGPLTLTGTNADVRVPVSPSRLGAVAFALAKELGAKGLSLPAGTDLSGISAGAPADIPAATWASLVKDLQHAGRNAVVLCGAQMPVEVHQAAHLLNALLGSEALVVSPAEPLASVKELETAVQGMAAGRYAAAIFWDVNPAFSYPKASAWKEAVAKVPFRAWIGQVEDETSAQCQVLLPENHWLESWGDFSTPGAAVLQQPTIGTLYDTRQGEDILLGALKALGASAPDGYHAYLQARWRKDLPLGTSFEQALHDGLVKTESKAAAPTFRGASVAAAAKRAADSKADGLELVLFPGFATHDGRHANNSWLQETPDPITKMTWDNPLAVSVQDAQALGIQEGDFVTLAVEGTTLRLPAVIQPGQAKGVLALALGYGRGTGGVAKGVGANAYPLMGLDPASANVRKGARLAKAGGTKELSRTQSHHRMEGRDIVRSLTMDEFAHNPQGHHHMPELVSLYEDQKFPDHKWGMVIDLAACTGCSACVVACQSENNVPVVGPEQVARGREMHWIRIDRYYEGELENPKVVHQPMLCQHCDNAPCENVCPVNATNHSPDGLNQMAYNRCVGTRYCANNCPYKVRRFNFLEYTAYKTEPETLANNPEVTVRPRGVMEKCSFCVQRINDVKIRAKGESRPILDGEITTACMAGCPSDAIVFGDLKDPKSKVAQLVAASRAYRVLEEVGAKPAISYLADLKNPADKATVGGPHAH
ncbi:molybdopterin oxidoreductase [Geothrix oryzae]|uniref:Molybdopterin oxidoreductase n=1 Tax=Geothrix oryzae TaxID=2927975 RepID=A0ABN6V0L6_9BACT|nr:TAT-variant-translocated molybdopterin oxidoreductase [Geothrix oryzae]BDU70421.1 molybdopterin oxidoreductase [Geothrix oryzae]